MSDLILHTFFNSSAAFRVRIALGLKKLDWTPVGLNIRTGIQRSPEYLAINPAGLVPTFTTADGTRITESIAIIDYLDHVQPEPLLIPKETAARARVLEITMLVACDIHPVNNLRILKYLTGKLGVSEAQKNEWMAHWVTEGFQAIEALLPETGDWCVGDGPTLADLCIVPQVANVERFAVPFDFAPFPRIKRIVTQCLTHPEFSNAAPRNQPDYIPH